MSNHLVIGNLEEVKNICLKALNFDYYKVKCEGIRLTNIYFKIQSHKITDVNGYKTEL